MGAPSSNEFAKQPSEADSLVKRKSTGSFSSHGERDRQTQASAVLLVCGLICGTYCFGGLLPAIEADPGLGWKPRTTSFMATAGTAAEMVGLLFAGPLADHVSARLILTVEALVVCSTMAAVSLSTTAMAIIVILTTSLLFKGFMWPTVGSALSANVSGKRQDQSFLIAAFGSRAGDISSALLLGLFMEVWGFSWHYALGLLLLYVIVLLSIAFLLSPRHLIEPDGETMSVNGQLDKCLRLVASVDGWLTFTVLLGTYCCWALLIYLAVILVEVYKLSSGRAAAAISVIPLGNAIGLATGVLASDYFSRNVSRCLHVFQGLTGVAALAVLAAWRSIPVEGALVSLGVMGFGFVVPAYLPYLVYAAASPPAERGFRLAMLGGVASCCGVALVFGYGLMREAGLAVMAPYIYGITAAGLFLAVAAMAALYWRLRDIHIEDTSCNP